MKLEYSSHITRTVTEKTNSGLFVFIHPFYPVQQVADDLFEKMNYRMSSSISAVPVAQWIARWASNSKAVGSIPTRDGFFESISKRPYKTEI
ncbi:hypothetical protein T06_10162 [Trichinella sp. T6]|nr:hypothetical protein T06_10162 [Trichinella sp. T6]